MGVLVPLSEGIALADLPPSATITVAGVEYTSAAPTQVAASTPYGGSNHLAVGYAFAGLSDEQINGATDLTFSDAGNVTIQFGGRVIMGFYSSPVFMSNNVDSIPTFLVPTNTSRRVYAVYTEDAGDELELYSVSDGRNVITYERGGIFARLRSLISRVEDLENAGGGGGGGTGDTSESLLEMHTGANIRTGVWTEFTLSRALTDADDERFLYIILAQSSTAANIMHIECPPLKVSRWRAYMNTGNNTAQGEFNGLVAARGNLASNLFAHNVYRIARRDDSTIRIASSHGTVYNSIEILLC